MRFIYTKAFAIFAVCISILAILIIMQLKGWLDPVRTAVLSLPRPAYNLVKAITLPVKNFFATIYQLRKIAQENDKLKNDFAMLQQDLVDRNQQARENEALRKELGFVKNSKEPLVACTVLSNNALDSVDGVILNCGKGQGVSEGQAVISQGYLVGKIIYSGSKSSTALLATASNFSTDARISKTDQSAIVKGSFGSGIILDQLPQTSDLRKGSLVVTAGINDKIPKNILIGEISDVFSSDNGLFKKAALISPIDFNNLEFVFVVKQ